MKTNKDLLHQYADTGAILSSYQSEKLPANIRRTYLRRRILQDGSNHIRYQINHSEFNMMDDELKTQVVKLHINNDKLKINEYDWAPDEIKMEFIQNEYLTPKFYSVTPQALKRKYVERLLAEDIALQDYTLDVLSDIEIKSYLHKRVIEKSTESYRFFNALSNENKLMYASLIFNYGSPYTFAPMPTAFITNQGAEFTDKYIDLMLKHEIIAPLDTYKYCSDEQKKQSIRLAASKGKLKEYHYVVNYFGDSKIHDYYKKMLSDEDK